MTANSQPAHPFNPEEWRRNLIQGKQKIEADLTEAIANLVKLAESVDAVKLFVAVFANISFGPEGSTSEITHGDVPAKIETLAYCAYPFFGKSKEEISPWHINECIEILDRILALRLIVPLLPKDESEHDPLEEIVGTVRMHAEVVRGSAFPEQTASEIISIQGHFEQRFKKVAGVGPARAQALLWSIIRAEERAVNAILPGVRENAQAAGKAWQEIKKKTPGSREPEENKILKVLKDRRTAEMFEFVSELSEVAVKIIPVGWEDIDDLEPLPTLEEWDGLIGLIGMTMDYREAISEIVEVRRRPLFVLPDRRVILIDISNALDVLWENFERVAKMDQSFFSGQYQREKARWLQGKTADYLSRIFTEQYIYQNLRYPDPDKNDGSTVELDIAVHWGPFLILLEAKAKQFRLESQLGDIGRLRSDIKANVEDAFDQAKRAARYIDQTDNPEFIEAATGRQLKVFKNEIRRVYLITVSQHLLAGLATRLSMFRDLGLFRGEELPLSISIADLDIVTTFCDGPDVFLHYIERRLAAQMESLAIQADELDFFGAYLQTRLQPARLWDREGLKPKAVSLLGFSSRFDDWFAYKRGDLSTPTKIELEIPPEIRRILAELRERSDYAARWISFALLDMPDSILDEMARNLSSLRTGTLRPGMFRRWTHAESDTVVSVVGSLDLPPERLEQRTRIRAVVEKYRHKAAKSVGLGIMVSDKNQPFHSATWVEGPWKYDADIEAAMQDEPPFVPAPGTKLPGRNDPCICGSGKKFKRCCLHRIQAAENNLG